MYYILSQFKFILNYKSLKKVKYMNNKYLKIIDAAHPVDKRLVKL